MHSFLEGERIYLRVFDKSDIPVWYDWFNDSLVTQFMNKGIFPNSIHAQEEFFNTMVKGHKDLQLAVILKENDVLIGSVGIHNIDWVHRHGDVSILIGNKTYWGKGIATSAISLVVGHAFKKMNLWRLTAGTAQNNLSTQKCFEKNGFILEGTKREHFFYNGDYVDTFIYGLLRKEWGKKDVQKKRQ